MLIGYMRVSFFKVDVSGLSKSMSAELVFNFVN
jgi:hypothetical protein